jgi:hypothetical protein
MVAVRRSLRPADRGSKTRPGFQAIRTSIGKTALRSEDSASRRTDYFSETDSVNSLA